ncbi:MAG: hypothetical protein K6G57_05605 [Lachnospiraceae bacterium]|nr:hypothetical protein [Lachnospiraceae bacterium]
MSKEKDKKNRIDEFNSDSAGDWEAFALESKKRRAKNREKYKFAAALLAALAAAGLLRM